MRRLLKSNLFWCMVFAPFFVSMFYLDHFVIWLVFLFYFLLTGVVIIGFSMTPLTKIAGKVKRYFLKVTNITIGCVIILFFGTLFGRGLMDIPYCINKEYETVVGVPSHVSKSRSSRNLVQTISIEGVTFRTMVYELRKEFYHSKLKITYLPNSRYIIDIQYAY
jgi:hypothetical protein